MNTSLNDINALFLQLSKIIKDSVKVSLEEKRWANMPSFYNGDKFVRLIPFKNHINVEAKAIKNHLSELDQYQITPKGMLQIEVTQEIPEEIIKKIFKETLTDE